MFKSNAQDDNDPTTVERAALSDTPETSTTTAKEPESTFSYPALSLSSPPEAPDISGTESAWTTLATAVGEINGRLVKHAIEDLDTNLVITGIHSIVLTGLLARSDSNPQQNSTTTTNQLLSHIVNQMYLYLNHTSSAHPSMPPVFLNSPPSSPFLVTRRINIFWSASLMLSLVNASSSIFMKQWLRQHVEGIYSLPEPRIRVRQFYEPGMKRSHALRVTAILPLLQLSIALFFAGLCLFTLDVYANVGYTTVPLIIAWATLFITLSFAPTLTKRFRWPFSYGKAHSVSSTRSDIDVLLGLDAMQRDDQLLQKICAVLHEEPVSLDETVDFVLKVIRSRLPSAKLSRPLPHMLDLTTLQRRTCIILTDTLAQALAAEVKMVPLSKPLQWTDAMKDCLAILCARLPCLLSQKASDVLRLCMSGNFTNRAVPFLNALMDDVLLTERFALGLHIQEHLRPMLLSLSGDNFDNFLNRFSQLYCVDCDVHASYSERFIGHREEMTSVVENDLMELVIEYLRQQTNSPTARWMPYHSNIMVFVNNVWCTTDDGEWYTSYTECFTSLLLHPIIGPALSTFLFHHTYFSTAGLAVYAEVFKYSTDFREDILATVAGSVEEYIKNFHMQPEKRRRMHPYFMPHLLRFLRIQIQLLEWATTDNHVPYQSFFKWFEAPWQTMFSSIASALHTQLDQMELPMDTTDDVSEETQRFARLCLESTHEADVQWKKYLTEQEVSVHQDLFIEDDLRDELYLLVSPEEAVSHREACQIIWGEKVESTVPATMLEVTSDDPSSP